MTQTNITHKENTHILIYTQIDTQHSHTHKQNTHTYTYTYTYKHTMHSTPATHSQAQYTHKHRLTHRHSHQSLGLTTPLSVRQEECPCLASPGTLCSPELSVSPLRANTLQAEWRRSVTVPQTYTHIDDMVDIFSIIRDLEAQLKNCP